LGICQSPACEATTLGDHGSQREACKDLCPWPQLGGYGVPLNNPYSYLRREEGKWKISYLEVVSQEKDRYWPNMHKNNAVPLSSVSHPRHFRCDQVSTFYSCFISVLYQKKARTWKAIYSPSLTTLSPWVYFPFSFPFISVFGHLQPLFWEALTKDYFLFKSNNEQLKQVKSHHFWSLGCKFTFCYFDHLTLYKYRPKWNL
jgi:hypothetical protein